MYCMNCNRQWISPSVEPFGGYTCDRGHLLCTICNREMKSVCPMCDTGTVPIKLTYCTVNEIEELVTDDSEPFSSSKSSSEETVIRQHGGDTSDNDTEESIYASSSDAFRREHTTRTVQEETEPLSLEPSSSHNAGQAKPKSLIKWTPQEVWEAMHEDCHSPNYAVWTMYPKSLKDSGKQPPHWLGPKGENHCMMAQTLEIKCPRDLKQSQVGDLEETVDKIVYFHKPPNFEPPIPEPLLHCAAQRIRNSEEPLEEAKEPEPIAQPTNNMQVQEFDGDLQAPTVRRQSPRKRATPLKVTFCDSETSVPSIGTQTEDVMQLIRVGVSICKPASGRSFVGKQTNDKPKSGVTFGTQTPDDPTEFRSVQCNETDQTVIGSDSDSIDEGRWRSLIIKSRKARVVRMIRLCPQDDESLNYGAVTKDQPDGKLKCSTDYDESFEPLSTTPDLFIQNLFNTYRVKYTPPKRMLEDVGSKISPERFDAPPQYELITTDDWKADKNLEQWYYKSKRALDVNKIKLERTPLFCPEATCRNILFLSEIIRHFENSHPVLPLVHVRPHECVNFCIDPILPVRREFSLNMCFMVDNVITNLGTTEFKNLLPMMLLTTTVRLNDLLQVPKDAIADGFNHKFLLIWVAGMKPEDFLLSVTLTVWHRSIKLPSCHIVHSCYMDNIRMSESVEQVIKNGNCLLLSEAQVRALTNNQFRIMECQLQVH